jgi:hypothetical protein
MPFIDPPGYPIPAERPAIAQPAAPAEAEPRDTRERPGGTGASGWLLRDF